MKVKSFAEVKTGSEGRLLETNDRKQQILLDKLFYFIVLSNYR